MNRFLYMVGASVGSWAGWMLGEKISNAMSVAFLLSSLGTFVGIYAAWRIIRDYLN